jgi:uncharacterized sulfatase
MMKYLIPRLVLLSQIAVVFAVVNCPAQAAPPNILVIYSDDHGWADLGVQGVDPDIRTPHLDQLAQDGVRCTRGYVSAPQCVPSRAGVLTGRYQQRFGLEDNNKGALPLAELTIAERLKSAGYVTGQVGKWHLDLRANVMGAGKKDRSALVEHMPHGQGFDEYFRGELTKFYASHDLKSRPFADAPHLVEDRRFRVDVQTEAALAFLSRRAMTPEQPWFLYLAYFTPHAPSESPEPWFSKTPAHLPRERRQALAMLAAMDDGIGQVRAKLKALGQSENTLIFFIGDNGAATHEDHWNGSVNKPLIGEKGMLTDGGTRVPFLVSWPGKLPAGKVYEHPVSNLDVAATACEVASIGDRSGLDGTNLIPYLTGENTAPPHEQLFWRWGTQAAVLEFPWKLIRLGADEQLLFDVTQPEGEKKNLIADHPDIAARLNAKLKTWSEELQPPGLPTEMNPQDARFFAEHIDSRFAAHVPKRPNSDPNSIQGWLCRNGSLSQHDGAIVVKIDSEARSPAFLTLSPLDFLGPAKLVIRTRGEISGAGSVSYRIRHELDFDPKKRIPFEWKSGETSVSIGATSRLIQLRVYLPPDLQQAEIQSISLQRNDQPPRTWDFTSMP